MDGGLRRERPRRAGACGSRLLRKEGGRNEFALACSSLFVLGLLLVGRCTVRASSYSNTGPVPTLALSAPPPDLPGGTARCEKTYRAAQRTDLLASESVGMNDSCVDRTALGMSRSS